MNTTPSTPFAAPNRGVRVVDDVHLPAQALRQQGVDVGADPALVHVRRRPGDAVLDDGGERHPHRAGARGVTERRHDLDDDVGDRIGRRRLGGGDAVPLGGELACRQVDRCALDAGPADVHTESGPAELPAPESHRPTPPALDL